MQSLAAAGDGRVWADLQTGGGGFNGGGGGGGESPHLLPAFPPPVVKVASPTTPTAFTV